MANELDSLREKIDAIDANILAKITERAAIAKQVLAVKQKNNPTETVIYHPDREQKIISKMMTGNQSILPDQAIATIFQSIINACRTVQIDLATEAKTYQISVQGIENSYSEQALLQYCQQKSLTNYKIHYATASDRVLQDINTDKANYGIVAVNNSQGGLVSETIAALEKYPYLIIDSLLFVVRHSLLMRTGDDPSQLKFIYSHPQALAQCRHYISKQYPHCTAKPWMDTALAARDLAAGKLPPHSAAIAHANCGKQFDLNIVEQNIQDLGERNETLFLLIGKRDEHNK